MVTFWEIAVPSVYQYVSCLFVLLVISHFGSGNRILVLVVPVPNYCLVFYFSLKIFMYYKEKGLGHKINHSVLSLITRQTCHYDKR